jgi:hypothetical protein
VQGRGGRSGVEGRAQRLTVDGDHALGRLGEARHEGDETSPELLRIQKPEHPAEGVVARNAPLQLQEAAQKALLGPAKLGHVHRRLPAAEDRAHRDHQDLQQIVPPGIARPWILDLLKARRKPDHQILHRPKTRQRR